MQQMIHKVRDKYTYGLLLLFVPLEILSFLWEPEAIVSKAILVIKFALCMILYLFYADKQKWVAHLLFFISCISIGVSTFKHGGAGTALLILTMLSALLTLPKIEVEEKKLRKLFLLLACGSASIVLYGMIANYLRGISAFSWRGVFNPNSFGIALLSVFCYLSSSMHSANQLKARCVRIIISIPFLFLLFKAGCRSALLCIVLFFACYYAIKKTDHGEIAYYLIAILSVLFCYVLIFVENLFNVSITADELDFMGKRLFSGREVIWTIAFKGFLKSPLWGQPSDYLTTLTGLSSAHNVTMGILVAVGLIPYLAFIKIVFAPRQLLIYDKGNIKTISINKVCFIASIALAVFECIYTDNRLNLLFLPLLLSFNRNDEKMMSGNEPENALHKSSDQKDSDYFRSARIAVICLLLIVNLLEPLALNFTYETLPIKVNANYLEEIGYGNININVLANRQYDSREKNGVIWDWNGEAYDVIGTAEQISFIDFFNESDKLPEWIELDKQYHVIFESDSIRFRVYYYVQNEPYVRLVDTSTSIDFTIPKEACGLIIRLALEDGKSARESTMPIIYAIDNEPLSMVEKRKMLSTRMNQEFWDEIGYDKNLSINLLGDKHYPSQQAYGILWEWSGKEYNVMGKANRVSFVDFYSSPDTLPEWLELNKVYHVIYESDIVRFRLYYYLSDGNYIRLIDTTTSTDFIIPSEACGLIIRLAVEDEETVGERVMPIITTE